MLDSLHPLYEPLLRDTKKDQLFQWLVHHRLFDWPEFDRFGEQARDVQRHTVAHNMRLMEHFRRFCHDVQVPVMPIKGIYLLDGLYADRPQARQVRDIDLMIPARDAMRALEALDQRGYRLRKARIPVPIGSHFAAYPAPGVMVDVHTRFSILPRTRMEWFQPTKGRCHGADCLLPEPGRHTLYCAWHLLKHIANDRGVRLIWAEELFHELAGHDRPLPAVARRGSWPLVLGILERLFQRPSTSGDGHPALAKLAAWPLSASDYTPAAVLRGTLRPAYRLRKLLPSRLADAAFQLLVGRI